MAKDFHFRRPSGFKKSNEPKVISVVLDEFFESNEPLAVAFRDRLFRDFFPNTELGIDLKLITRKPGRMPVGNSIIALLVRDGVDHYTAVENAFEKKMVVKRNAHLYEGSQVNVNKRSDGVVYPTFRYRQLLNKTISFKDYCYQAAQELIMVAGLLEE